MNDIATTTEVTGTVVAELQIEVNRLREQGEMQQRRVNQLLEVASEFKVRVKDAVIAAQKEHDFCVDGTNKFLEDLGLEGIEREYHVTWVETWEVEVTRSTVVSALSEDEATEYAIETYAGDDFDGDLTDDLLSAVRHGETEYQSSSHDDTEEE